MNIPLIKGSYSNAEAVTLITDLINVKIKFHENKICNTQNEEDVKMRERRIKQLQNDLQEIRKYINGNAKNIAIESDIVLVD